MKVSKYKLGVIALAVILFQTTTSTAQKRGSKEQRSHRTINIDIRGIEAEIANVFRTVAIEIEKIDLDELGATIEQAGREIGEIEVHVENGSEYDHERPGQHEYIGTEVKSKVISKTYTVDNNDKLAVTNQFGSVKVNVWSKNEIRVDVEIKAYESNDRAAQDLLETVKINELRQSDLISYKTVIGRSSTSFWSKMINGKEERRGVQINYVIHIPARNPLDINNQYGSIELPDLNGPLNIVSSYGALVSGRLNNPANQVKVSYGSANIGNYANGNLAVSYGSLNLEHADNVTASIKYSTSNISRLTGSGNFNVTYSGGFKIGQVDRNVKNLTINSSYSGLTIGIDESANLDFDVKVSYAGFNYGSNKVSLQSQFSDSKRAFSPSKHYKGSIGKGSDSKIVINSSYGGVKFL